jgi:hypothetical protein
VRYDSPIRATYSAYAIRASIGRLIVTLTDGILRRTRYTSHSVLLTGYPAISLQHVDGALRVVVGALATDLAVAQWPANGVGVDMASIVHIDGKLLKQRVQHRARLAEGLANRSAALVLS